MIQQLKEREKLFTDTPMTTNRTIQVNDDSRIKPNINLVDRELANCTTSLIRQENQIVYTHPIRDEISIVLSNSDSEKIDESNLIIENQFTFVKLWKKIEEQYILNDAREIFKYLQKKQNIAHFLLSAAPKIAEVFTDEKLELKILYDPEIVGWKKLIIAIHTDLDGNEAFEKLKLLDNNWWLDASELVWDELGINIDFNEI